MSHIPAAAMPHAKPHETPPAAAPRPKPAGTPWLAIAIGGALIAGTAALVGARLRAKPTRRKAARKPATRRKVPAAKARRSRATGKE